MERKSKTSMKKMKKISELPKS